MGRYFLYRMHPVSVAEWLCANMPGRRVIREPQAIDESVWKNLLSFGGFPEPLLTADERFSTPWQRLRHAQLF